MFPFWLGIDLHLKRSYLVLMNAFLDPIGMEKMDTVLFKGIFLLIPALPAGMKS